MSGLPIILLVDDNDLNTALYSQILDRHGFHVRSADSGPRALELLNGGLVPELILMDIELGDGMDGVETTRIINERWDYPVVFLSANTYQQVMEKVRQVRAYSFIPKGSNAEVMLTVIDLARRMKQQSDWAVMFQNLFDRAGAELYLFRQDDLHFVEVNRSALNNLGYTLEEIQQLTPLDIKPEFQVSSFHDILDSLLSGQRQEVPFETLHRRKDGSLYPVHIILQKFWFKNEPYFLAVGQDLTILKNLKQDFEVTNSLYAALLHDLNEAVVISQDESIVLWNKRSEAIFGISREEALGENLVRLLFPAEADLEGLKEKFPIISGDSREGQAAIREMVYTNRNGDTLNLEVSCNSLKVGSHHFTIMVARDQSERHRLLAEIEHSLKEYTSLADNAPVGILKSDNRGNILYVNQAALTILGSPGAEATKRLNLLTLPRLREYGIAQELEDSIDNQIPKNLEREYETIWGKKIWMQVRTSPVVVEGRTETVHIIINDITERKRYEQEILEHNRTMGLFIEGLVSPAWLLDKERRIILQNKAASEEFRTSVGDFCWSAIQHCKARTVPGSLDTGARPTHCSFCQSEYSLSFQQKRNELIEIDGTFWDVWWIPLGTDVYLHYAINVTKYKEMEKKLEQLAVTDGLLGIYNRRYTAQRLQAEVYRARRYGSPFSIIMMDIDHFKNYNDNFGHDAGDLVLKTVALSVQQRLRQSDVLGRWGGEEFLIIAPETPKENAAILAEKIRVQIETTEIPRLGRVTSSFGVAGFEKEDTDESLLKRADNLLYKAKQEGRNRVCF